MALLQISEPGLSAAPHQRRLAVGIDLGTTNSLVATVRSGQAETLADEQGRHLLPSVVHYQQQGHAVGYDARANAARDPANTISSVKRMMGRSLADIQTRYPHLPYQLQASENGLPMIATAAGLLNPIRVSADILKALAERATATLGGDLDGCSVLPEGFAGVDSYAMLAQWLEDRKLPSSTIENIFSESLLKVVKQCTM